MTFFLPETENIEQFSDKRRERKYYVTHRSVFSAKTLRFISKIPLHYAVIRFESWSNTSNPTSCLFIKWKSFIFYVFRYFKIFEIFLLCGDLFWILIKYFQFHIMPLKLCHCMWELHLQYLRISLDIWDILTMRWSVLNPDQILPIPHLAFLLHVKASFSPQNISAASKRAPKWFMIGSMSVQYFSSSLRSKEGAQYYGTFTFWKGELFTSCVAGYFWKYTSFVTCVDSPGYIALHIQIVQAGNRTKKEK